MNDHALGFKIIKPLGLKDWKVLVFDDSIALTKQEYCPADTRTALRVFCTLIDDKGLKRIRIGWCSDCGYIGYMDRPQEEWMKDFYLSGKWDNGQSNEMPKKNVRRITNVLSENFGVKNHIVRRIEALPMDRNRPVLEIGCGYGESLGHLKQMGFTKMVAVENSTHRADIAVKTLGIEVFTAPFEDREVQSALKKHAPFGLIFSEHVLEHVYHPEQVIACAASLQGEGDYLMISVPYFLGELSMMVIGFLPHLHSFMPSSLERLLNARGYQVVDTLVSEGCNMNVVAQKISHPRSIEMKATVSLEDVREKIIRGLGIGKKPVYSLRRLWWNRKTDIGGQLHFFTNPVLEKIHYACMSRINHYLHRNVIVRRATQSLMIRGLSRRYTSSDESMFEIQFEGPIILFYK